MVVCSNFFSFKEILFDTFGRQSWHYGKLHKLFRIILYIYILQPNMFLVLAAMGDYLMIIY